MSALVKLESIVELESLEEGISCVKVFNSCVREYWSSKVYKLEIMTNGDGKGSEFIYWIVFSPRGMKGHFECVCG